MCLFLALVVVVVVVVVISLSRYFWINARVSLLSGDPRRALRACADVALLSFFLSSFFCTGPATAKGVGPSYYVAIVVVVAELPQPTPLLFRAFSLFLWEQVLR